MHRILYQQRNSWPQMTREKLYHSVSSENLYFFVFLLLRFTTAVALALANFSKLLNWVYRWLLHNHISWHCGTLALGRLWRCLLGWSLISLPTCSMFTKICWRGLCFCCHSCWWRWWFWLPALSRSYNITVFCFVPPVPKRLIDCIAGGILLRHCHYDDSSLL